MSDGGKTEGKKKPYTTFQPVTQDNYDDEKSEWWVVGKVDDYDLVRKLNRVGCRYVLRDYVRCSSEKEKEYFPECIVMICNIRS